LSAVIVAIDTASDMCAVAAISATGRVATRQTESPNQHSATVLPFIAAVLDDIGASREDIRVIAVGIGPGSFTGIRIGVAVAQGLALGLGCMALPLDSLQVFAEGVRGAPANDTPMDVVVALDARMGQLFCGRYRWGDQGWSTLVDPTAIAANCIPDDLLRAQHYVGTGAASFAEHAQSTGATVSTAAVSAQALAHLALRDCTRQPNAAILPSALRPNYVRDKVAATIAERAAAATG
jgi:tRNA threonylcarbamoyladenosine biosynthesis protein TsaB